MADTKRTKAALLLLFADGQAAGSITPQDMRDLIVSLLEVDGGYYFSVSSATTIGAPSTFVKVAGTTAATTVAPEDFTIATDNRITYTGTRTVDVTVHATLSVSSASNNQVVHMAVYKNGTTKLTGSDMTTKTGTGGDVTHMSIVIDADLATNDYLELWVANDTSASNVTVVYGTVHLSGRFQ